MKGVKRRRCQTKLRKMLFCRMKEVLDTRVDMQLHSCNLSDIFVSFTDGNRLGQPSLAFKKTFTKAHCMYCESGQHTGPNDKLCPFAVLHNFWQLLHNLVHPLYSTIQESRFSTTSIMDCQLLRQMFLKKLLIFSLLFFSVI